MLRLLQTFRDTYLEPTEDPEYVSSLSSSSDNKEDILPTLQRLCPDPNNTYYFEATSDEMELFGIKKGNLLLVDRSKNPTGGMIVIAWHKGKWMLRQLITHLSKKYLSTGKEEDQMVEIHGITGPYIWGVVTWSCCPQMEFKRKGLHKEGNKG